MYVNLVGFRRHGHNEVDNPRFTQPKMYQVVDAEPSIADRYAKELEADGTVDNEFAEKCKKEFVSTLDAALKRVDGGETKPM